MDKNEFLRHQFVTLREEIKAIKARLFWIVAMGLFGLPVVTYLAASAERSPYLLPMVPYLVIVLIVMFLAEQNALMRAGRYIRETVEPEIAHSPGWEAWLESRSDLRLLDRHFFAVFTIVFFVYYFMTIGMAVQHLWSESQGEPALQWWTIAALVTYGIGAVWAVSSLLHHWRSCTGTSDAKK
jgi:hypothetical protein